MKITTNVGIVLYALAANALEVQVLYFHLTLPVGRPGMD